MSKAMAVLGHATAVDLAALPPGTRAEVVAGEVVDKASPSFEHGDAQGVLVGLLAPFRRRAGGPGPGGWWLGTEIEIELETHEVYVPDLVGWRRERVPERPTGRPIRTRPDWVCEILSPSTAARDLVSKHRTLHRCGVPHYWVIDPERETLTVQRWQEHGYLVVVTAGRSDVIHAEPFEATELRVGLLFGDEPEA